MAKKQRRCLDIGRDLVRVDCGIAYVIRGLGKANPDPDDIRTGLETARRSIDASIKHGVAKKVLTQLKRNVAGITKVVRGQKLIPVDKLQDLKKKAWGLRDQADKLHREAEKICKG